MKKLISTLILTWIFISNIFLSSIALSEVELRLWNSEVCKNPIEAMTKIREVKTFEKSDEDSVNYLELKRLIKDVSSELESVAVLIPSLKEQSIKKFKTNEHCEDKAICPIALRKLSELMALKILIKANAFEDKYPADMWFQSQGIQVSDEVLNSYFQELLLMITAKFSSDRLLTYTPKKSQQEIISAFKLVKFETIQFLKMHIQDESILKLIISKINLIGFKGCDPLFENNAEYSNDDKKICIGLGFLEKGALLQVLAHEVAHSFDPCIWTYGNYPQISKFPFAEVVSCLRESDSAGAKREDLSSLYKDQSCSSSFDQIGEAFADWVSAEVLVQIFSQLQTVGYGQDFFQKELAWLTYFPDRNDQQPDQNNKGKTKDETKQEKDEHPNSKVRMNNIFFAHPVIRKTFGCEVPTRKNKYCSSALLEGALVSTPSSSVEKKATGAGGVATAPQLSRRISDPLAEQLLLWLR